MAAASSSQDLLDIDMGEFISEATNEQFHHLSSTVNQRVPIAVEARPFETQQAPAFECWGAEAVGSSVMCVAGFKSGKGHFKNKFCSTCRNGIDLPAARVRGLTAVQQQVAHNSLTSGFWKRSPAAWGGGDVRIVNQTLACDAPGLAIFREPPPHDIEWALLPEEWLQGDRVRLFVAKGTLIPLTDDHGKRRSWLASSAPTRLLQHAAKRARSPPCEKHAHAHAHTDGQTRTCHTRAHARALTHGTCPPRCRSSSRAARQQLRCFEP
tara:strand:+ start:2424 stop:3224 length:801 start_codon:yes stop_codon:yes gene_type:complete